MLKQFGCWQVDGLAPSNNAVSVAVLRPGSRSMVGLQPVDAYGTDVASSSASLHEV